MQDAKEEVRSRLNIEDIVGEYVQLKRAGRNFKGLSPFSGEKTPSFFVSPDKHIWHDFSSNKGGDVFSFIMEAEGMEFRQALEHLARKAGVDLSQYQTKGNQEITRRKQRLQQASELAANYYQHSLLKNTHALDYVFKQRGLSKEVVQAFKIGYAPSSGDALVQFLLKKGFSRQELADAGLTNRFGGDMFRGRMTVPLMDSTGQVIGFTARIIVDDPKAPKYLNTQQTLLYDKSRHVFGLSQAKEAIRHYDYAVIVEGNLDVVSSYQVGVRQVVATAGTAMTESHLRALKRLSGNVRLAFDGDRAGVAATERAIPIAGSVGVELKVITLPDGDKDPDDLIRRDPAKWQQVIDTAQPAVDWVLDHYAKQHDTTTASGKRHFTTLALAVVQGLTDPVEKDHYQQKIARMTSTSLEAVQAKLRSDQQAPTALKPVTPAVSLLRQFDHIDTLFGLAWRNPQVRELLASTDPAGFEDPRQKELLAYFASGEPITSEIVPKELQNIDDYVKIIIIRAEKRYEGWDDKDQYFEAADVLRRHSADHNIQTIRTQKQAALDQGDTAETERLTQEEYILIKEMKRGQR